MTVTLLTPEQKGLLIWQPYEPGAVFFPIQDKDNNWIISAEEVNGQVQWVKELPGIEYEAKPVAEISNNQSL